jgi:hypothetical protein
MLSPPRDLQFLFGAVAATSDKNRNGDAWRPSPIRKSTRLP